MPQITITLSDQLCQQVAAAVEGQTLSAEDFVLLAIAQRISSSPQTDPRDDASYSQYLRTGLAVPATEILDYYKNRLEGKVPPKPAFRKMEG
jgi:hypothetical protein